MLTLPGHKILYSYLPLNTSCAEVIINIYVPSLSVQLKDDIEDKGE